jgi:glycosyltransferase involved in cell wall biosynthesis
MKKIILSAYGCHPNRGSEPGVGWNWLVELSKYNNVWILFYKGQEQFEAVSSAVKALPAKENIHLIPIDVPFPFGVKKLFRFRYEVWQIKAYFAAKKIIKEYQIDLIHQVTIAAWWFSGYYYLFNTKLIWGPISGGQYIPFKAFPFLRIRDRIYEAVRTILTRTMIRLSTSAQMNFKKAELVFAPNESSLELFNRFCNNKCVLFSEIGVQENKISTERVKKQNNKIKFMWSGLLIPSKNFGLLLESLKSMPENINWELIVAGEGKLLEYWRQKVDKTKIKERIKFLGKIPFQEMQNLYNEADIFVFPSLREASGSVILEAMANGLPVIALELNGAKNIIEKNCGILIPVKNKTQMINDFRDAIIKLCESPELRYEMGENARKRVEEHYLWEKRGVKIDHIYNQILNKEIN